MNIRKLSEELTLIIEKNYQLAPVMIEEVANHYHDKLPVQYPVFIFNKDGYKEFYSKLFSHRQLIVDNVDGDFVTNKYQTLFINAYTQFFLNRPIKTLVIGQIPDQFSFYSLDKILISYFESDASNHLCKLSMNYNFEYETILKISDLLKLRPSLTSISIGESALNDCNNFNEIEAVAMAIASLLEENKNIRYLESLHGNGSSLFGEIIFEKSHSLMEYKADAIASCSKPDPNLNLYSERFRNMLMRIKHPMVISINSLKCDATGLDALKLIITNNPNIINISCNLDRYLSITREPPELEKWRYGKSSTYDARDTEEGLREIWMEIVDIANHNLHLQAASFFYRMMLIYKMSDVETRNSDVMRLLFALMLIDLHPRIYHQVYEIFSNKAEKEKFYTQTCVSFFKHGNVMKIEDASLELINYSTSYQ
jgi:hypothetical protein